MPQTIEEIESQIAELQKTLNELKNPKLKITRRFTGQYFEPFQEKLYRRMESENIPIWECFSDSNKDWSIIDKVEADKLEKTYIKDCLCASKK